MTRKIRTTNKAKTKLIAPYEPEWASDDGMIDPYAYVETKADEQAEEDALEWEQPNFAVPALDEVLADAENEGARLARLLLASYEEDEDDI